MKTQIVLIALLFFMFSLFAQEQGKISIIPQPNEIVVNYGFFELNTETVVVADSTLKCSARQLTRYLEPATSFNLRIYLNGMTKTLVEDNFIRLQLEEDLDRYGEEGYFLEVTENHITISASGQKGIFYGIQTLRQLMPKQIFRKAEVNDISWQIPCVQIEDNPRFSWRGLMIDYSRTFFNKRVTMHMIDILSLYKMNVLHMHLTDDQGWRLEIRKYPELTETASKFHESYDEPPEREGYFTQEDIREIIIYASERNVVIVPEIEMPGHSAEVFSVFPELSCTGETYKIHPFFKGPGIHEEVLCVGNNNTLDFTKNVLSEVCDLFPSEYIHVGGDEAPKTHWKECPKCQQRMKDEGLKDEFELQSWFIKEMEKHLNSKGKFMIGWNEILEGGLAPNAAIMFWHGDLDHTIKATEKGHPVVMSPTSHCYFDYTYEKIPLEKVYEFDPVPVGLEKKFHDKILGCQANFWSHIDRTVPKMNRQIFPRLIALSEVGWTENDKKDWQDFSERLESNLEVLNLLDVYYMETE
ncbi:beta-N-acetylhexosaminidase [Bacteroidota bacterium]